MQNTQNIQRNELFTVGLLLLQWSKDFLPKLRELPEAPDIITLLTLVEGSKRDEIPIAPSGSIYIKAATLWHMGEILKATKLLHEYLEGNPLDLVAIQVCRTGYYFLGMSIESKELIESLIDRHESLESYAYLLGILGFIYNQLGNHVLGLEYCKTGFGKHARLNSNFYHTTNSTKALELNPHDHWARHALTHCYQSISKFKEGVKMLNDTLELWHESSLRVHLYWHLAIFHVKDGNPLLASEILDTQITLTNMMDLVDYSSLSFRLATNPPKTLLTAWKPHTHVHSLVFNDAHALLVIPIEEFENWTGGIPTRGDYKVVYDSIGENLFKGIIAFRLKNYEECITIMKGLDLEAIGGSNAQREVFEEMVEIAVSFTKTIAA